MQALKSYATLLYLALAMATHANAARASPSDDVTSACNHIAAVANLDRAKFEANDIVKDDEPFLLDIQNNGRQQYLQHGSAGSMAIQGLFDETGLPILSPIDFENAIRRADRIGVFRLQSVYWRVAWNDGGMNGTVSLVAATNGQAVCLFKAEYLQPSIKLFNADKQSAQEIRDILSGDALSPPLAHPDLDMIQDQLRRWDVETDTKAWQVDLGNTGHAETYVQIFVDSGPRCEFSDLARVSEGRVIGIGLITDPRNILKLIAPALFPISPLLKTALKDSSICSAAIELPVLGKSHHAYVVVDSTFIPGGGHRAAGIKLLIGIHEKTMDLLAEMTWSPKSSLMQVIL